MPESEPRPYRIGATLRTTDTELLPGFAALHARGKIDHLQVRVIPGETFYRDLAAVAAAAIPSIVHAPHHGHGVNPCAPAAYDSRPGPAPAGGKRSHLELQACPHTPTLRGNGPVAAVVILLNRGKRNPICGSNPIEVCNDP